MSLDGQAIGKRFVERRRQEDEARAKAVRDAQARARARENNIIRGNTSTRFPNAHEEDNASDPAELDGRSAAVPRQIDATRPESLNEPKHTSPLIFMQMLTSSHSDDRGTPAAETVLETQKQLEEQQRRCEELEIDVSQKTQEIKRLRMQLEDAEIAAANSDKDISALRQNIKNLQEMFKHVKEQKDALEDDLDEAKTRARKLQRDLQIAREGAKERERKDRQMKERLEAVEYRQGQLESQSAEARMRPSSQGRDDAARSSPIYICNAISGQSGADSPGMNLGGSATGTQTEANGRRGTEIVTRTDSNGARHMQMRREGRRATGLTAFLLR